ncbi:lipoprotein [Kaistia sp. 32K]|uniref:alpha/beta hydrolase n=1 Tax=Kaistia sp. 32K TaxID=2795690 RepID=UPI001938DE8C|nr:alpha/beta hydrolase [Kaistia sp. 32K]BCP51716.1 lipoprotein [Kaistia sp. 32K]
MLILGLAIVLAACASRPQGVLTPVKADAAAADKVDLLVATTRARSDAPGVYFNGERGSDLSLNNIVVSIPEQRQVGSIQWPSRVPGDPARDFVTTKVTTMQPSEAKDWFKRTSGKKRRVLIFVHGFNTQYADSIFRFAQIVHDTDANVAPILFSWPSRGNIFDYNYDRESANYSRSELATVIRAAATSPAVSDVTIMAHSMGGWLAVEALRQIALQDGRVPAKVSNLILASPDLDIDVFRKQVLEMGPKRPHITLFVSTSDRALRLSRLLSGRMTRLGAVDITREPYLSQMETATGITILDLTALQNGDRLNHSKFATSPEVVQLMGDRLIQGQSVTDSSLAGTNSLGSTTLGAGQVIGSAAGAVLTAPILIFESAARK